MDQAELRILSIRNKLQSLNVDGLLVTDLTNIRWLSGFSGSYARLLITQNEAILSTDSRYWIQARAESPAYSLFPDRRVPEDMVALLNQAKIKNVAIEADHLTLAQAETLKQIPGFSWTPLQKTVENLREIKDQQEILTIRNAAQITDLAMSRVSELVRAGMTEKELAWELEKTMRENGAEGVAFPIIVAFGSNSALPHHSPGERQLCEDEIVLVDMGAALHGYKSDLTRTFYFGRYNERFQQIFDLVLQAQIAALDALHPGALSNDIHQISLDVIDAQGLRDKFPHGLGHSVGLDIHEQPWLSTSREPVELQPGMTMTVEPGIYIEGWGGVRIEDLVYLDDHGNKLLSTAPKEPYLIP